MRVLLSLECNVTCVDNEQHTAVHWAAGTHLCRYKQEVPDTRGKKLAFWSGYKVPLFPSIRSLTTGQIFHKVIKNWPNITPPPHMYSRTLCTLLCFYRQLLTRLNEEDGVIWESSSKILTLYHSKEDTSFVCYMYCSEWQSWCSGAATGCWLSTRHSRHPRSLPPALRSTGSQGATSGW